jgi:hypothetical protein
MTAQHTQSNPRQCQHSMVTDLCGLCIRDGQIAALEQQRTELMALVKRWKCFGAIDPVNASHLIADSQRLIAKADAQVAGASRERKYDTE